MRPTRRRLLLGGAALGLTASVQPASATPAAPEDAELLALSDELARLRRKARRLQRRVRPGGDRILWSAWSRAVTECADICDAILAMKATSLAGVAVKYQALVGLLVEDDAILDRGVRRQVIVFGRELQA